MGSFPQAFPSMAQSSAIWALERAGLELVPRFLVMSLLLLSFALSSAWVFLAAYSIVNSIVLEYDTIQLKGYCHTRLLNPL
jgi:hypothetical protein